MNFIINFSSNSQRQVGNAKVFKVDDQVKVLFNDAKVSGLI